MKKQSLLLAVSLLGLAACQPVASSVSTSSAATSTSGALTSSQTSSTLTSTSTSVSSSTSASTSHSTSASSSTSTSTSVSSSASSSTSTSTSTSTSSSTSTSTSSSSSSSEPVEKLNVTYVDDAFEFGGEGDADAKRGRFLYWAGDGGAVTSATKDIDGVYRLAYTTAGAWYGVQLFYKLPYATTGDLYHLTMTFHTDGAGPFRVNTEVFTFVVGDNLVDMDIPQGSGATLSIQLGEPTGGGLFGGHNLSFLAPVINDNTAGALYHKVEFYNGSALVKAIEVKDGNKVLAPSDPTPAEGYVFDGWYAGAVLFDPNGLVTFPVTYLAKFITEAEATKYTVTFKDGTADLGTAQILKGKVVTLPATVDAPFGYAYLKWFTDVALTAEWHLATDVVTADLTLFGWKAVTPTSTFMNTNATGWRIPASNLANADDGALRVFGFNGWAGEAYVTQVNFEPAPIPEAGKTVTIGFDYKINADGADAQIYDNATLGNKVTLTTATDWVHATISYTDVPTQSSKLTFELGALPAVIVEFELTNITVGIA